jgi:hypothetical protein
MPTDEVPHTGHMTLHYYLAGNANDPFHSAYRSDNPWAKMNALRDELYDRHSHAAATVGGCIIATPDTSVWRMELWGDITPVTLEQFAIRVLELVESRLNMRPTDDIRAIVADRTGFMREWALTA